MMMEMITGAMVNIGGFGVNRFIPIDIRKWFALYKAKVDVSSMLLLLLCCNCRPYHCTKKPLSTR